MTSTSSLRISRLRCEYRNNPLGIDASHPRLDWLIQSNLRGQAQTAYQIMVATSKQLLDSAKPDLWDSGKVTSSYTCQIQYAGKMLTSRLHCYWKVCVWDRNGHPTPWSNNAQWSMGLLKKTDWKAQWIGFDKPIQGEYELMGLTGAHWIWAPDSVTSSASHPTSRFFRKEFVVTETARVNKALLIVFNQGAKDVGIGGWRTHFNGKLIDAQHFRHHLKPVDITRRLKKGRNTIAVEAATMKNGGLLIAKVLVFSEGRDSMIWTSDPSWKCSSVEESGWFTPDYDDRAWAKATSLGSYSRVADDPNSPVGQLLWGNFGIDHRIPPPRYLRKEILLSKPIKRATIHATALGLYQLSLNGDRIGKDEFTPGWTEYFKRCNYQTYEVTNMLSLGSNALGAVLADGWHSGYIAGNNRRAPNGDKTRLLAQLEVDYKDGTRETIVTDASWRAGLGPLREADIMKGAMYDARLETNWCSPEFNAADWSPVDVSSHDSAILTSHPGNPVRAVGKFTPKSINQLGKGHYVFDLGQNIAGVCQLKVTAKRGTRIVMRHGEWLRNDRTIYIDNLASARAEDTYICRGGGEEVWIPPFTFHGFQYVEVTGLPSEPSPETITGIAWSADAPRTGHFSCSDAIANKLFNNIYWTQRANFIDVPTDCPQRAERLGWTGDAQMYIRTATYMADVAAFFTKWIPDLNDAQLPDGAFPNFAPRMIFREGPHAWADAGVICPWIIYQAYGDMAIIEKSYKPMKRWIEYCIANSKDLIRPMTQWGTG